MISVLTFGLRSGIIAIMVFKPRLFNKPSKGDVQGFKGRIKVDPSLNHNDIIINLIII